MRVLHCKKQSLLSTFCGFDGSTAPSWARYGGAWGTLGRPLRVAVDVEAMEVALRWW